MLLFMRRAKRNIPLTGRLLSPDINHRHGNETVLTKGETDGGIQMQTFCPPPPHHSPYHVRALQRWETTSEWTIRGGDVQVRWDFSRGRRRIVIPAKALDVSGNSYWKMESCRKTVSGYHWSKSGVCGERNEKKKKTSKCIFSCCASFSAKAVKLNF